MLLRLTMILLSFIVISYTVAAQKETHNDTLLVSNADSTEFKIFEKVDIEALFPGGDVAWRKFLEHNLKGDVATENGAPAGKYTVWVQFIVDKQGNITDVKALTNNGYGMEKEVERIIKIGPQWQPASQNGRNVKAYRKQPVTFMIEDDGFEIQSEEEYVLYSGIDNHISIKAKNVKPNDLSVIISAGSITPGADGNYIVRVKNPGRVILHLYNKRGKEIGAASFEVKLKDQPMKIPNTIKS